MFGAEQRPKKRIFGQMASTHPPSVVHQQKCGLICAKGSAVDQLTFPQAQRPVRSINKWKRKFWTLIASFAKAQSISLRQNPFRKEVDFLFERCNVGQLREWTIFEFLHYWSTVYSLFWAVKWPALEIQCGLRASTRGIDRDISLKVMMYSVDVQANHFMSAAKGACPKFGLKS